MPGHNLKEGGGYNTGTGTRPLFISMAQDELLMVECVG